LQPPLWCAMGDAGTVSLAELDHPTACWIGDAGTIDGATLLAAFETDKGKALLHLADATLLPDGQLASFVPSEKGHPGAVPDFDHSGTPDDAAPHADGDPGGPESVITPTSGGGPGGRGFDPQKRGDGKGSDGDPTDPTFPGSGKGPNFGPQGNG